MLTFHGVPDPVGCSACVTSLNLLSSTFYIRGKGGSEWLKILPKVTCLVSGGTGSLN